MSAFPWKRTFPRARATSASGHFPLISAFFAGRLLPHRPRIGHFARPAPRPRSLRCVRCAGREPRRPVHLSAECQARLDLRQVRFPSALPDTRHGNGLALLGRFELSRPEGAIKLPGGKLAGLLAYLACTAPRPQSRERLSTLFWGSHFVGLFRHVAHEISSWRRRDRSHRSGMAWQEAHSRRRAGLRLALPPLASGRPVASP